MKLTILLLIFLFSNCYAYTINENKIDAICNELKIDDCQLVKAIIKIESNFNTQAQGRDGKGSYGLMQIKCSTALKFGVNKCSDLYDPKVNILYGMKYIDHLKELLNTDNIDYILSAYNGVYTYLRKEDRYAIKKCNSISKQKGRKCEAGEPFNIEYIKKAKIVYNRYDNDTDQK